MGITTIKKKRFEKGVTLIELMISISVLLGIIALATGTFVSSSRQQARIRAENVMKSQSQNFMFRLSSQLNQTRMLMSEDGGIGEEYFDSLNMSGSPPRILPAVMDTRLPIIRSDGSLSPEKDCTVSPGNFFRSNVVGNSLLFARYIGKFSKFSSSITNVVDRRALDIYEFKHYYLTDDNNLASTNKNVVFMDGWYKTSSPVMRRLRLIEWTSVKYVDYDQLLDYLVDASSNSVRTQLRSDLAANGITTAWRRAGTNYDTDTFYAVGTGSSTTLSAVANHTINRSKVSNAMRYDNDYYSVAYNQQTSSTNPRFFPTRVKVPFYYNSNPPACGGALPASGTTPTEIPTATKNGYPGGFEVMIVGPASGRSVLVRLTTIALVQRRNFIEQADSITAYARDL